MKYDPEYEEYKKRRSLEDRFETRFQIEKDLATLLHYFVKLVLFAIITTVILVLEKIIKK